MRSRHWQIEIELHQSVEGKHREEAIEAWDLEGWAVEPGIDLLNRK